MNVRADQPETDFLDLDVESLLEQSRVPGCSVAVLEDGEIVFSRGYGTSRVASGDPVTQTTRMQACSMSKPVSVLAALRLVEQGLLDLDADVADYLTRWTLPANGDWHPRLTLRQLASHTAGLTAHGGFPGYRRGSTLPSLVEVLSGVHPANAPGARVDMVPGVQFRYSGAGTSIIQLVMEEVTGTSAPELLAELVLEPLQMSASTFVQEVDDVERAHGHSSGGVPVPGGWHVQPEQCAAGLWTTPADYLRLMNSIRVAYAGGSGALIAPETARLLLGPVARLPGGRDMTGMSHIGLGFFVSGHDGAPSWFGHTGSNLGFVCVSMASVSTGHGAVVMFNGDNATAASRSILGSLARSRRWPHVELDPEASSDSQVRVAPHPGSYSTEDGLTVELTEEDGGVVLTVPGQPPIRLDHQDSTTLATDDLDLRVLADGEQSISLQQGGQVTVLRRSSWQSPA
jgi:CubicO group peptidase (beta-lactamase class C family)